MKYMLLMNYPYGKWNTDSIFTWPEEDAKAHIGFLRRFNEELSATGEYVTAQGLAVPDEAKIVPDDAPRLAPLVDSMLQPVPDAKPDLPDDPASPVSSPNSLLPGGNPAPGHPTAPVPGAPPLPSAPPAPDAPYVPTGMPGTPI